MIVAIIQTEYMTMREFIDKSENICKAVTNIIGKMIIIS